MVAEVDNNGGCQNTLLVKERLKLYPFSSRLFVFCNRKRDKLKIPNGSIAGLGDDAQIPVEIRWRLPAQLWHNGFGTTKYHTGR
ncbi:MAG: IS66 family insertion sequence element accessory protein TnpB [bacterium]